ncbi:MAG: hypothetical protein HY548_09300 [Elusimicrobia bacterium]|nr:hypothetical protein [Elusimicrobiota bacterium]
MIYKRFAKRVDNPTVVKTGTGEILHFIADLPTFGLPDVFNFGQVWGSRGQKTLLFEDQLEDHQATRAPKPPPIQTYLKLAYDLKNRLEDDPRLTHAVLGQELGLSRYEIIRTINLTKLAPEIQEHILSMPPTQRRRLPLNKKALRRIASNPNLQAQIQQFQHLFRIDLNQRILLTA